MYAKVESLGLNGLDAFSVTVEADISTGLPRFDIVGLPDMAVRESRERVRATAASMSRSRHWGARRPSPQHCGRCAPAGRWSIRPAPLTAKKISPSFTGCCPATRRRWRSSRWESCFPARPMP